jgi:hypothetical protein
MSSESEDGNIVNHNLKILAIIGARTMDNQDLFDEKMAEWVDIYGQPDEIVSGGAVGADTMAEAYAQKNCIPITVYKPDYERYSGKYAPIVRNTQIIEHSTHILAFPSRYGKGTQDSLRKAKKYRREIKQYLID